MRSILSLAAIIIALPAFAQSEGGLRIVSGPPDLLAIAAPGQLVRTIGLDGSLTALPGERPGDCAAPRGVAMHPGGQFVLTTSDAGTEGAVCAFAIDVAKGTLSRVQAVPAPAGRGTRAIAVDPGGRFVYATNVGDGSISGYSISLATGEVRPLAGSPFVSTDAGTVSIVIDPLGRFVYASNDNLNGTVSGFAIDRDNGGLSHVPKSPLPVAPGPGPLAIDPRGRFLYVGASTSAAFNINPANGELSPITTSFAASPQGLAIDPSGRFLFATYASDRVIVYRIEASGTLTETGNAPTGAGPKGVAVARDGRHLFVVNAGGGTITTYRIADDGTLTSIATDAAPGAVDVATFGVLAPDTSWVAGAPFVRRVEAHNGRLPLIYSVADGALPPGMQLDTQTGLLTGAPAEEGTYAFTARVVDAFGGFATRSFTFETRSDASATVVEYYNAALDHYFITRVAEEAAILDQGMTIKGWKRTGKAFATWTAPRADTSPICRFYIPPELGNSHFFGRGSAECDATGASNPTFVLEDPAFMHMVLPVAGTCAAGSTAVYRVFSNRPDANHRYTTDRGVRDAMVTQGWIAEGDGPDRVVMCAP
jgi:6-phosphogluconolactonase (cycloisomerase 2 family)